MPDFKDLNPILLNSQDSLPNFPNPSTPTPSDYMALGAGETVDLAGNKVDPIFGTGPVISPMLSTATAKELHDNRRFDIYSADIVDQEDQSAYAQSGLKQATNGVLKGLNLAATTVAGGFGMLYGAGKSVTTGRLSDIWDNPVMNGLDEWNNEVDQNYLPNYYTNKEKDSSWYSTDNWFTTNFLFDKLVKNSGFAVGAMLSGNIANAALGAAGAALGTGAMGLATAAEASQAFKLFTPLLRNMARGFSAAKNIEVAAALEKGIGSIADIEALSAELNAIARSEIVNIAKTTNKIAKFSDVSRRTAIATYSSAGEASFEALQTGKEFKNSLIEQYKLTHNGAEPEGEDLETINQETEKVGKTAFLGNMALLGITEYVQLGRLLGSTYAAEKQAANSLMGKADDVVLKEGKWVKADIGPTTRFGKLYGGVSKGLSYVWDPKEMGQELGQYALQVGTQNYFRKSKESNNATVWTDGFLYGMFGEDESGKDVGALVSKEGIESGILGGLTGGLMQASSTYKEGKARKSNTEQFINSINNAPTFQASFKDKLGNANRAIVLHQQEQQATIQGEELEARDLKADSMHTYLAPRIKYGRFDMIMEDMKELREGGMTEQGLAELKAQGIAGINDNVASFQKRVNGLETYAKNVQELYKSANLRYSGETLKDDSGKEILNAKGEKMRKYSPLVIDKLVYAASKIADYDVRIPQLSSKLTANGIQTYEVLQSIIENSKPNIEATEKALQDINALNVLSETKDQLKIQLSDMIELSLRRQSFMQEYDAIKSKPLNYEEDAAFAVGERRELDVTVTQLNVPEGKVYRKPEDRPLEVGKEYSLKDSLRNDGGDLTLAPKMTVMSQTLGGEFEVRMPNGSIKFLTPSEFKEFALTEEDNRFEGMEDMLHDAFKTILDKPRFADTKKSLIDGGFDSLVDKLRVLKMSGEIALAKAVENEFNRRATEFLKEKAERAAKEALYRKNKEEWKDAQTNIVSKAATVPGINTSQVENPKEPAKKDESHLFRDTTTESEDRNDVRLSRPHIKRARVFLNKIDRHKKRGDMRAVLVHAGNAALYGLDGIVQMSYGMSPDTPLSQLSADATDVNVGFLAQVYMILKGGKAYFVDENGDKISNKPISKDNKVDLDKVIFQTMSTTELNFTNGEPKYRAEQKEQAEYEQKAYKLFRQQLWAKPERSSMYKFDISRGFAVEVDGAREFNHVGGILLDESTIENQEGLIEIPTTGTVSHGEKLMKFPNGVPVLKYGATVTFLNNRLLTDNETKALYKAIERVTAIVSGQMERGEPIRPDSQELTFIISMLYWTKGETKNDNQIRIDEDSSQLVIGDQYFNLTEVSSKEAEIVAQLQKAYFTTNNKTLKAEFTTPFTEFYVDNKGELQEREWPNYQVFLLSATYPDGSARPAGATPLTTSVAKPTPDVPYAFKQRYSTMLGLDFPVPAGESKPSATVKPKQAPTTKEAIIIDDKYTVDGVTENEWVTIHETKDTLNFTARIEDKEIIVTVTGGPAIDRVMADEAGLQSIRDIYSEEPNIDKATPEQLAKRFFGDRISLRLNQEFASKRFKKVGEEVVPEAITVEGHKIDGTTKNTFTTALNDTVDFTAKIENDELVVTVIGGPAFDRIKNNADQLQAAKDFLSPIVGNEINTASPEAVATTFWNARLTVTLNKAYQDSKQASVESIVDVAKAEDLVREMINGKAITNFTIEEQTLINTVSVERKQEIQKEEDDKKGPPPTPSGGAMSGNMTSGFDNEVPFRIVGFDGKERTTKYDLDLFKEWAARVVPNIPYEILENLLLMNDGRKAWGVFEKGVAKFVKGGLRGTEYHEVGEAIWFGFLTEEERNAILADERTKKGTFTDRETGKKYSYSDPKVSNNMLKERIMDDFSDFRLGKLPARNLGERVRRFFKMIIDFFKSFVSNPSLKEDLFDAIDTGKFKYFTLDSSVQTIVPQYRAVEGLTETETVLLVDDMLARATGILFSTDQKELLYEPRMLDNSDLFTRIENMYNNVREILPDGTYGLSRRDKISDEQWEQLKIKVKDALQARGVSTVTEVDINSDGANKNDYMKETFVPEGKSNSSRAIKISQSTMIEREPNNQENQTFFKRPDFKYSDPKQKTLKLMNFNQVFNTILAKMSNTSNVYKFINKVVDLANNDSNYVPYFEHIGGSIEDKDMPLSQFDFVDWRFFIDNWQTFTKQKPTALIQYTELDKVYTGAANLFDATRLEQAKWIENLKTIAKQEDSLIEYNRETRTYDINVEKLKEYSIKNPTDMIKFLSAIGIEFPMSTYKKLKTDKVRGKSSQQEQFSQAVSRIYSYIGEKKQLMSLNEKILNVNEPYMRLGELYVRVTNPNQDSTYFGVEGQRVGAYTENNAPSLLENEFNEVETLDELLELRPDLNDIFSQNSQVLKLGGLFFNKDGTRTSRNLKVKYIQGDKNLNNGKGNTTSSLSIGDRSMVELNQNLKGDYYILIPADGTTEWMMNLGHSVDFRLFDNVNSIKAWKKINEIFTGYLFDDIKIALDSSNRSRLKLVKKRGAKQLRFFTDILNGKKEYNDVLSTIEKMIEDKTTTAEDIIDYVRTKQDVINSAIKDFITNTAKSTETLLKDNSQLFVSEEGSYSIPNLDETFVGEYNINKREMTEQLKDNFLNFSNANYIINNIEYHKILFGDPLQFDEKEGKLDLIKRIKSFLSPRRTTFDMPEFNTFLNNSMNEVPNTTIILKSGDPGYNSFKPYTNSVILKNHMIYGSLSAINKVFGNTDESDAFSWLRDGTYREIKIKNKQWSEQAEAFHQWQMAYTRKQMAAKGTYSYGKNKTLEAHDIALTSKPSPEHRIEVLKPIVTGSKYGMNHIEQILHKTAQMPVYYSMVEDTAMENMYIQMFKQDIGYTIVASGAKMGIEEEHSTYNPNGSMNQEPYKSIIRVPWKAYGLQVETATDHRKMDVTRGSQLTKMSSMNLFNGGEVIGDTPERQQYIKDEYLKNVELLNRMHENAYKELLNSLSIVDMGDNYIMTDGQVISTSLMDELMRRTVSDNLKDTLELDPETNMFRIPFEASPSYIQIRNVLYAMVDKAIVSPKMHGAAYVQVPVTMFEEALKGRSLALKTDEGYKKITKQEFESLSEEQKKKVVLTDDTLKFYTKEEPYCEIMVPHWFKGKFPKKKGESDKAHEKRILDFLNDKNKPQREKILRGIGFRIPSQSLSSIEVFKIKGFLPQYMGNTVVVPSEITTKAGSDFDIDKLNLYLKSVYMNANGTMQMIKLYGSEDSTKAYYAKVYEDTLKKQIDRLTKFDNFRNKLMTILEKVDAIEGEELTDFMIRGAMTSEKELDFYDFHEEIINSIIDQAFEEDTTAVAYLTEQREGLTQRKAALTVEMLDEKLRDGFVKTMYKRALENEYYQSLENLVTLPEVFDQLIKPVDDAGLSKIADRLDILRGEDESKIKNRTLDRTYMTKQRHAFVIAKKWVGVAASNITNLSLKQKSQVFINPSQFTELDLEDQAFLGDGLVQLEHNSYTLGEKEVASLSGITVKGKKEFISDRYSGYATAFVDVAKDPFILKIIQSNLVINTFMFLENIGVGEQTAFFLNQPIISEYLKMLDGKQAKTLFDSNNIASIRGKFGISAEQTNLNDGRIDLSKFESNIESYYKNKGEEMSHEFKAEQSNVLKEFLKYAKMAEFAFEYAQATNYDTTRVTSGDHLARKQWQTEEVARKGIITNINDVLDSTFIGYQKQILDELMVAMGAVLKLEDRKLRVITEKILKPYGLDKYLSNDDFNRVANKIKSSFLDFIIQTKSNMYQEIYGLVADGETSAASDLEMLKQKYTESTILQELEVVSGVRPDGSKSIKIAVKPTDAYDENRYVGLMREMRDTNPELKKFYDKVVKISILQGTSPSAISIRNIIPIEDYSSIIAPIMEQLVADTSLEIFAKGFFQKNQFKDDNIVPKVNPGFRQEGKNAGDNQYSIADAVDVDPYGKPIFKHKTLAFPDFSQRGISGSDRKIMVLHEKRHAKFLKFDVVKVPRIVGDYFEGRVDFLTGRTVTDVDFAQRKAKGDYTLNDFFGYQKVRDAFGKPLVVPNYKNEELHIYKLVNLYGDGNRLAEYYPDFRPSVIDNGTAKIDNEMTDAEIFEIYSRRFTPALVEEKPTMEEIEKIEDSKEYAKAVLNYVGAKKVSKGLLKVDGQHYFLDFDSWKTQSKPYGMDLFIYPKDKIGTEYEEIYIASAYGDSEEFFSDETEGKANSTKTKAKKENKSSSRKVKGDEVKPGIFVNQKALTEEEQMELFNYLKPYLESQGAKTNKGVNANKMIGLGLRWDYKSNNPGKEAIKIPDTIDPSHDTKYGYYNESINGQPLGAITPRFRELMEKASGVDMTNYDGAIINLYDSTTFISAHNDVNESKSAIKYPVIGINLGGTGNFSIESHNDPKQLKLTDGSAYVFGVDGVNRTVYHRTFPQPQQTFLPELKTSIDGKTYPAGSYRVTITMRRVMPLTEGMPKDPTVSATASNETQEGMKMHSDNVAKILSGEKTTTTRASIAKGGGIKVGETKVINFGGKDFNVTNRGEITIQEAGGAEKMAISEGFPTVETETHKYPITVNGTTYYAMFKQTVDWFKGYGGTYVYDIVPILEQDENYYTNLETDPNEIQTTLEDEIAVLEREIKEQEYFDKENKENTPEYKIVQALPKYKITTKSAEKETGGKVGIGKDVNIDFISNTSGMSVENAAGKIWNSVFDSNDNIITDAEIRNVIIDILNKGRINYMESLESQRLFNLKQELFEKQQKLLEQKRANITLATEDRFVNIDQFKITVKPDGKMFFETGNEVTEQTIKNKVNIRKELQEGTLRVSTYNKSKYFVLLDDTILGSGKTNLGKETITDPKIKEAILAKAITYKKTC